MQQSMLCAVLTAIWNRCPFIYISSSLNAPFDFSTVDHRNTGVTCIENTLRVTGIKNTVTVMTASTIDGINFTVFFLVILFSFS